MHEVLVNRLGGLSLPRKSVVRLTDRPDMTLAVYRGRKTTMQQQQIKSVLHSQMTVRSHLTAQLEQPPFLSSILETCQARGESARGNTSSTLWQQT